MGKLNTESTNGALWAFEQQIINARHILDQIDAIGHFNDKSFESLRIAKLKLIELENAVQNTRGWNATTQSGQH